MNELRRRSVMDITRDSGSFDGGSIPSGDIKIGYYQALRGMKENSFFHPSSFLVILSQ